VSQEEALEPILTILHNDNLSGVIYCMEQVIEADVCMTVVTTTTVEPLKLQLLSGC
jgi:hypothetical protein